MYTYAIGCLTKNVNMHVLCRYIHILGPVGSGDIQIPKQQNLRSQIPDSNWCVAPKP